jgi:spermidine synthase
MLSAGGNRATSRLDDIFNGRSFFAAYRVAATADGKYNLLLHGSTVHGATARNQAAGARPSRHTYYHAATGVGRIFAAIEARALPVRRIAAIGLGVGEIACYRRPGQTWTFYEIDPLMVRIARNPKLFPFLSTCAPETRVVVGDGRLTIARRKSPVDLLVLDAFSSDAIPAHLLTREAFRVYLSKLAPKGILVAHISNRHLDMEPVLAAVTHDLGLAARLLHTRVSPAQRRRYRVDAIWVAIARDEGTLGPYLGGKGWRPLRRRPGLRPWTDAYSNIVSILK